MNDRTRLSLPNREDDFDLPIVLDKYQAVSLADKTDHTELFKALIVEINRQLMFSRYQMRVPNGVWELAPITCGINSEIEYSFSRIEKLYADARWTVVKVLSEPKEKIEALSKELKIPEPITEQLKKLFDLNGSDTGYFQMKRYVVLFFKNSYEY